VGGLVQRRASDPLAEIVAATLVAGDLAIAAAFANGRFIEGHRRCRAAPP
jgi:hydroxymethylglutaryl-CoA reductase